MSKLYTGFVFLFLLYGVQSQAQSPWEYLFNGKDLEGWIQLGGEALYSVEDECIVGRSVYKTPNSFLTTPLEYGDFILEFEVKVDPSLNSGVQFRSNSLEDYRNGRVHGYQVEIDPSDRAFSGGVYDEQRRGWLYPLSMNEKGRKAFRNGEWNHYRVEAVGNEINTWVNGIHCTHLIDDMTSAGFIGLQVHSIGSEDMAGTEVRWRHVRMITQDPASHTRPKDPEVVQISYLVNRLTEQEKRKGWRLLWDGTSSEGWRGAKLEEFPASGWVMEDGVLTVLSTDGGESTGPGDIITREVYRDFELSLEFKISEGANSGIKYFVDPELNKGPGSAIGCEFQILDDRRHPDAQLGKQGNRTVGGLYDLIPPANLSIPGRGKQFKGVGSWNHARIVSKGGKVSHWLNHEKTVEYDRFSQIFTALVGYSKYEKWDGFGQWPEGHILLQDHGDTVHFRSIKIREF
jgi:hypothetical protein